MHFVYKNCPSLYFQCIWLSMPLITTGLTVMNQLDFTSSYYPDIIDKLQYNSYFLGLIASNILNFTCMDPTRGKLMLTGLMTTIIATIGIFIYQDHYNLVMGSLGFMQGCDWAVSIMFTRELVGWEESKSIYLNDLPYIHFFTGILIRNSMDFIDTQVLMYSIIGSNAVRILTLLMIYHRQNPIHYYRLFLELKGRKVLQNTYRGNVDDVEFFHINNNEQINEINMSWTSLLGEKYLRRLITGFIISLCLWTCSSNFLSMNVSAFPYLYEDNHYFLASICLLAAIIISPLVLKFIGMRRSLLISSATLLVLGVIDSFEVVVEKPIGIEYIEIASNLIFFGIHYTAVNMYITQLLPIKGMAIVLNLQWITLGAANFVKQLNNSTDVTFNEYYSLLYPLSCLLTLFAIIVSYEVAGMSEYQIQSYYKK